MFLGSKIGGGVWNWKPIFGDHTIYLGRIFWNSRSRSSISGKNLDNRGTSHFMKAFQHKIVADICSITYVRMSLTFWLPLCKSKALGRVGTAVSRHTCQSRCYPQIGSNPGPRYDAIHT